MFEAEQDAALEALINLLEEPCGAPGEDQRLQTALRGRPNDAIQRRVLLSLPACFQSDSVFINIRAHNELVERECRVQFFDMRERVKNTSAAVEVDKEASKKVQNLKKGLKKPKINEAGIAKISKLLMPLEERLKTEEYNRQQQAEAIDALNEFKKSRSAGVSVKIEVQKIFVLE